jgi:hypothetical protein
MKWLSDIGTRRQLFRTAVAGVAIIPLLSSKSADARGWNRDGDHSHGDRGGRDRGGTSTGCCCLLEGTRVSTPTGERPIEDLQIGDEVLTLAGPKAIKWVGYDKYTRDKGRPWPSSVMPIRVVHSAIADQAPHCDLYLSPEHCVFINDVLIPVKHLVNGTSIAPAALEGMAAIEYYHIEFDSHEVIFAEGAAVESFIDETSSREFFLNFVEYERLYGCDQAPVKPFAPILRYRNRRQRIAGLARSVVSSVVDVRDPIQVARDQLARRVDALPSGPDAAPWTPGAPRLALASNA